MPLTLDLDAYCERIQWAGQPAPTYETLAGLLRAHLAKIPFENLDVLLGRGVCLELDAVQQKLVQARRGGYCFEHATLFAAVLEAIGFRPVRHAARVALFVPLAEAPRTHMFLTVPIDGKTFVVDPGFGPFASPVPVPLIDSAADDKATHRMIRHRDAWALQVPRDGQKVTGWVSTLEPEHPIDFELANHFVATHPASLFVNMLLASAALPQGRVNVMNRDVTILRGTAASTERLADRHALRSLLNTHFGFDLPEIEGIVVPAVPEWR